MLMRKPLLDKELALTSSKSANHNATKLKLVTLSARFKRSNWKNKKLPKCVSTWPKVQKGDAIGMEIDVLCYFMNLVICYLLSCLASFDSFISRQQLTKPSKPCVLIYLALRFLPSCDYAPPVYVCLPNTTCSFDYFNTLVYVCIHIHTKKCVLCVISWRVARWQPAAAVHLMSPYLQSLLAHQTDHPGPTDVMS